MPDSYISNRIHVVFATKSRLRALSPAIREKLFPSVVGMGHVFEVEVLAIGGAEDHIHLLISLPAKLSLSEAVKKLKANSSRWIKDEFGLQKFAWQTGYGAFSVGLGDFEATRRYIGTQVEHHKRRDFRAEMAQIFQQHGVDLNSVSWFDAAAE